MRIPSQVAVPALPVSLDFHVLPTSLICARALISALAFVGDLPNIRRWFGLRHRSSQPAGRGPAYGKNAQSQQRNCNFHKASLSVFRTLARFWNPLHRTCSAVVDANIVAAPVTNLLAVDARAAGMGESSEGWRRQNGRIERQPLAPSQLSFQLAKILNVCRPNARNGLSGGTGILCSPMPLPRR